MFKTFISAVLLCAVVVSAGGCLVGKSRWERESGVRVSKSTLGQVKPGETTEDWVIAALGEPTSRNSVDEHTSILRYDHTVKINKGGYVFLIFAGGESIEEHNSVLFEVTDGVVDRYWTESSD